MKKTMSKTKKMLTLLGIAGVMALTACGPGDEPRAA